MGIIKVTKNRGDFGFLLKKGMGMNRQQIMDLSF